jgi:endonuclease/exonuclease/phosphatase family metal-dependent hydrolase
MRAGVDVSLESRQEDARSTIRLASYNIHAGKGRDGRRNLLRTAECLQADFDLIALNEVRGREIWQRHGQAEILGRELGMPWLFAPAVRTWGHREAGNALLTPLPVQGWYRLPLPREHDNSCRNAVLATIEVEGQPVQVLLTHVARRPDEERRAQLGAVIRLFLSLSEPAILLGDMNADGDDRQILRLLKVSGIVDPIGDVLGNAAPRRIDWILARGLQAVDAGVVDDGSSDHPMVWAELRLGKQTQKDYQ